MENRPADKKIYFDCTFTYQSGLNTGIQRVVRNILQRADFLKRDHPEIIWAPVISVFDKYFEISPDEVLKKKRLTPSFGLRIKLIFEFIKINTLKFTRKNQAAHRGATYAFLKVERLLKLIFRVLKYLRSCITVFRVGPVPVKFGANDHLILLDAFWTYDVKQSIQNSLETPGKPRTTAVVYDLIPLTHPQYVDDGTVKLFSEALPKLLELTDQFICISEAVKSEVADYCQKYSAKTFRFDSFPLGSDFRAKTVINEQSISTDVKEIFNKGPVWLTVGTIEPRKNHEFILDTFDRLWENGNPCRLLIVGRVGWKNDKILDRILNHPQLNNNLFFSSDTSDEELQFCYRQSKGLIFASFTEGFGLPIVEAKASGIRVLCSDIPVFREVGGGSPTYFDLNDKDSLYRILTHPTSHNQDEPPTELVSWDKSAEIFFQKLNSSL